MTLLYSEFLAELPMGDIPIEVYYTDAKEIQSTSGWARLYRRKEAKPRGGLFWKNPSETKSSTPFLAVNFDIVVFVADDESKVIMIFASEEEAINEARNRNRLYRGIYPTLTKKD
ncbi:hypothetical protein ACFL2B_00330 [Patescibacteria group bacterium]